MLEFLAGTLWPLPLLLAAIYARYRIGFRSTWPLIYRNSPGRFHRLLTRENIKNECDYIIDTFQGLDCLGVDGYEQTKSYPGRWYNRDQVKVSGLGWFWQTADGSKNRELRYWHEFLGFMRTNRLIPHSRVYIPNPILNCVYRELLGSLTSPISIVSNEGDEPALNHVLDALVASEFVSSVDVHNVEMSWPGHEKVRFVPLGVKGNNLEKFSVLGYPCSVAYEDPRMFQAYVAQSDHFGSFRDPAEKQPKVLCALGESGSRWTSASTRDEARAYLQSNPHLSEVLTSRITPFEYFDLHRNYAFEISPPGNGLDCYRHWECLYMGTIPLVFHSPKDEYYRQFPMVVIRDLSEITQENLLRWQAEFSPFWDSEGKWINRLYDAAIPWRSKPRTDA